MIAGALLLGGGALTASVVQSSEAVDAQVKSWVRTVEALGGRVVVKSNERTAFGGRQVTVLKFGRDFKVKLTSSYRNGPWLPGGRFGASLVSTNVTFSPNVQRLLDQGTDGKPVKLETLVSFAGRVTTTIDVPAASFEAEGTRLSWSAARATLRGNGPRTSSELSLDRVSLEDEDVTLALQGVRYTDDLRASGDLNLGSSVFSAARVDVRSEGEQAVLRDFALRGRTGSENGKVDFGAETSVGRVEGEGLDVRDVRLAWSLRSLDRVGLVTLLRSADDVAAALDSDDPAATRGLVSAVTRLLSGGPELSLDEASFSTPQGGARLSANVKLAGAAKLDVAALAEDPSALLEGLSAGARFEVDESLLRAIEAEIGEEGSVSSFVESGLLTREDGKLRAVVDFDADGVRVNGETLPPELFRDLDLLGEGDAASTSEDGGDLAATCAKDLFLAQELYRLTHETYASDAADLEFDEVCADTVDVVIDEASDEGWSGAVRSDGRTVRVSDEGLDD